MMMIIKIGIVTMYVGNIVLGVLFRTDIETDIVLTDVLISVELR